jgi:hypothetical protein
VKKRSIKLDNIRIDGDTQPRAGISKALVGEYAESYDSGCGLPPPTVFFDGVDYWLADGFHRWHAANKLGYESIVCEVINGTVDDARWYSYAANQTHGQRRGNEDKAKPVKSALLHPNGAEMSDTSIAEYVGVSSNTVLKYRAELELTSQIAKSTTRQGRDGRTIDTSNIGKRWSADSKPEDDRSCSNDEEDSYEPDDSEECDVDVIDCHSEPGESEPAEVTRTKWLKTTMSELAVTCGSVERVADMLDGIAALALESSSLSVFAAMCENAAVELRRN